MYPKRFLQILSANTSFNIPYRIKSVPFQYNNVTFWLNCSCLCKLFLQTHPFLFSQPTLISSSFRNAFSAFFHLQMYLQKYLHRRIFCLEYRLGRYNRFAFCGLESRLQAEAFCSERFRINAGLQTLFICKLICIGAIFCATVTAKEYCKSLLQTCQLHFLLFIIPFWIKYVLHCYNNVSF